MSELDKAIEELTTGYRNIPDMRWTAQADCKGKPTVLFFPPEGVKVTNRAKAICRSCPVRLECINHALQADENHGMWGGFSSLQIRSLRARGITKITLAQLLKDDRHDRI